MEDNRKWFWKWLESFWKENGQKLFYSSVALGMGFYMIHTSEEKIIDTGYTLIVLVAGVLMTKIRSGRSE